MREEYTWSLVDPKPILVYLEHYDAYIVYWIKQCQKYSYPYV